MCTNVKCRLVEKSLQYCCYLCGECSDPDATRLLQVKMNILPYDTCHSMIGSWVNNTVHICIGSVPTRDFGICAVSAYYPHMPIGMLWIYRLLFFCLFVCLFVCLSAGILVTDISGTGRRRAMKFCRMVDLRVHQVISPFGEFWLTPQWPKGEKIW